jgi:cytoskeletal protein RodZ
MSQDNAPQELVDTPQRPKRKEHFLGTVLLVLIIFFIVTSAAGIVWVGYSQYRNAQTEKAKPTIEKLAETPAPPAEETPKEAPKEETPAPPAEETKDIKSEKVAVLNGGAATGSAVKLAEALKKEGLTAVTTGSTQGDFTGTVVYYKKEKGAEAKALLTLVQKEYKEAETKEQDTSKTETSTEDLTVILGAVK